MKKATFINLAIGSKDKDIEGIFTNLKAKIGGAITKKTGVVSIETLERVDPLKYAETLLEEGDNRISKSNACAIELKGPWLEGFKRVNQITRPDARAFVFFGQ